MLPSSGLHQQVLPVQPHHPLTRRNQCSQLNSSLHGSCSSGNSEEQRQLIVMEKSCTAVSMKSSAPVGSMSVVPGLGESRSLVPARAVICFPGSVRLCTPASSQLCSASRWFLETWTCRSGWWRSRMLLRWDVRGGRVSPQGTPPAPLLSAPLAPEALGVEETSKLRCQLASSGTRKAPAVI